MGNGLMPLGRKKTLVVCNPKVQMFVQSVWEMSRHNKCLAKPRQELVVHNKPSILLLYHQQNEEQQ